MTGPCQRATAKPVIENWGWHGPTHDSGKLELAADKIVDIEVEHFQIDGLRRPGILNCPTGGAGGRKAHQPIEIQERCG